MIYLNHNATTSVASPAVLEVMILFLASEWEHLSSSYQRRL
jgi:cysteine sulfinate desulfinase/cysteine desulfurase-like protein